MSQHFTTVLNRRVFVVTAMAVGDAEALARRTGNQAVEPPGNSNEFPHVAACDQIRTGTHAETGFAKRSVKQSDAWEQTDHQFGFLASMNHGFDFAVCLPTWFGLDRFTGLALRHLQQVSAG